MENIGKVSFYLCFLCAFTQVCQAGQYCGKDGDQEFYCDKGHCCGDFKCCTYYRYYEMWWFWLIWCIIITLGCSCAYYRRSRAGTYSSLTSYFYPSPSIPPVHTSSRENTTDEHTFKLPSYEEVERMPHLGPPNDNEGAPPPYAHFAQNPINYQSQLNSSEQYSVVTLEHAHQPAGNGTQFQPLRQT